MKNDTRILFNSYLSQVAQLNGVATAEKKFTVAPSVEQTMETKIQESSDFLSKINIHGVSEQSGESLGLGVGTTIASRTDTRTKARTPTDPSSLTGSGYEVAKTDFDTAISYAKLDLWAKFPDFQTRLRDAILRRQALDRITIGFNGTSRAANTDRAANPLLQDVNIGWLQKYREKAANRVMSHGADPTKIKVGAGGDYANIDALVFDLVNSMIDPWYQDDTELVVLCGRKLLSDKYFPIINQANQPNTERLASDIIMSQKMVGNLPAVRIPSFPANALMVTTFSNLSIYYQEGARRRTVVDNASRDQIENYESSNEDYVIEDYGLGAVAEKITLV